GGRHSLDLVGDGGGASAQRLQHLFAAVDGTGIADRLNNGLGSVGQGSQGGQHAEVIGGFGRELIVKAQHGGCLVGVEDQQASQDRAHGVELKLEGGYDAEVSSSPSQGPEEVGVFGGTRADEPAIRGEDVGGKQVVASETEAAHEESVAASEGQARDAG